jgi:hypothetical protein
MVDTLIAVLAGGVLTLATTVAVDGARERRMARRAAGSVELELLEIIVTASGQSLIYPFPMTSSAWEANREHLVAHLPKADLIVLTSFYMQNSLVESGLLIPAPGSQFVKEQASEALRVVMRLQTPLWKRLPQRVVERIPPTRRRASGRDLGEIRKEALKKRL